MDKIENVVGTLLAVCFASCIFLGVMYSQAYELPKEPQVNHQEKDFLGTYIGDEYNLILHDSGIDIQYRYDCKWYILNNTLYVSFIDSSGKEISKRKYAFIREDGQYKIMSNLGLFEKSRVSH